MMSRLTYYLVYGGMYLLASLPFTVLFAISDVLYVLLRHVLRYRRKVVRTNLRNSFPEKSMQELNEIERQFYHYICDYLMQEVKTLRLSREEMMRRMRYDNPHDFLDAIDAHGSAFLLIPHYDNFEWLMSLSLVMRPDDLPVQIYKPIHNAHIDELFKRIRSRFGGINVPKHATARTLIKMHRSGKHMGVGLITDQSPNLSEAHHWTTFLNQDTVFMDGAEKMAKLLDIPVFYSEIYHEGRGYARVRFELICEHPRQTADGEITERFARKLEQTIRREPAYWFWSHKRWKLKRSDVPRSNAN